jgi:3-hydroxyacyl-CoA dehydrogenase
MSIIKEIPHMSQKLHVRRAAVLGAGVMGAQIAAHLVNAGVDTVLFDLPAKEGDPNGVVTKAIAGLAKLSPAPLASKSLGEAITAANYETGLEQLRDCDLVIEAIAERMDWKQDLYRKIAPFIPAHTVLASNTSGLGINTLAEVLPEELRHRFCGVHFFNPPRYMHLAELIPAKSTDPEVLEGLDTFLTSTLGKGVVYARDTPNFIGNRIGVFSILAAIHHTAAFKLGFDEVDAISGPLVGRPKSATYRTSDVVGLDTMAHVIKTMADTLPDDPWHPYFKSPAWLQALIGKGALGQKTGAGIFRKAGKDILVVDVEKQDYRPADRAAAPEVVEILKTRNPAEKFQKLRESQHPQAQFLWATFRDLFHYSAYHLADIAETARDVDLAIRWGYGWSLGPFETWQAAGWKQVAQWIADDIVAGKAMSSAPLPDWVFDGREGVHAAEGSFSPAKNAKLPRSTLPVYKRQRFPDPLLGEVFAPGETVYENDGMRLWTDGDDIAVASFKTKMHTVSTPCWTACRRRSALPNARSRAWSSGNRRSRSLPVLTCPVRWPRSRPASWPNSRRWLPTSRPPASASSTRWCRWWRRCSGMALGGGCEFQMHARHRVLAPGELHRPGRSRRRPDPGRRRPARSLLHAPARRRAAGGDVFAFIQNMFQTIAMAKVSKSAAVQAKELGFARPNDKIVFNARTNCCTWPCTGPARMAESGYRRRCQRARIRWPAHVGIATCEDDADQHEGGRLHLRARLPGRQGASPPCCAAARSRPIAGRRAMAARRRAQALRGPAEDRKTQQRIVHMLEDRQAAA